MRPVPPFNPRLGVTGSHRVPSYAEAVVRVRDAFDVLARSYDFTEVTTGAAPGVDTIAFFAAYARWPLALHRVLAPLGLMHNEKLIELVRDWPNVDVIYVAGGYLKRDDEIVANSDLLAAFPKTLNEERRSGTWATIRRGEAAELDIRKWPLRQP